MIQYYTLSIIGVYLVFLIVIGFVFSKKVSSTESFFLANRNVGVFALTATLTATVVGGSATIATGSMIYSRGLPGLWLDIGGGVGLILLGLFLAKIVRKTGLVTLPQITETFFDKRVRLVSAVLILITQIAWIALLIQGAQLILQVLLPWNTDVLLVLITFVFIFYTFLGGQLAVIVTDIVQFIIMIIGVCIIAAPLLFMQALPHFSSINQSLLHFPVNASIGLGSAAAFFFMMCMPHLIGPDIYSKVLSAKDQKSAQHAAIFSGVCKLIFALSIALIALAAVVLYPGLENPGLAIPMAVLGLPTVLAGILLAAFLSVMLSSADSILISAGTIFSIDLVKKKSVFISRIGIIVVGCAALVLAIVLQDIIKTLMFAYTIFTAGLTLPILFGFYKNKTHVTSQGALWGLILGGSSAMIWLIAGHPFGVDAVLIGMLCSLLPLLIIRVDKKKNDSTA